MFNRKKWELDRARGVDRSWKPVGPVAEHVTGLLRSGMTQQHVAEVSGYSAQVVSQIVRGKQAWVRQDTAAALLGVRPRRTRTIGTGLVSRVGAERRIRALLRIGWTHELMSAHCGIRTGLVLSQPGGWVTAAKHEAVVAMYDRLAMTRGPSASTRARATAARYPSPLAWDDDTIDDPAATPRGLATGTPGPGLDVDETAVRRRADGDRSVHLSLAERRALVTLLHGRGLNDQDAAAVSGLSDRTVLRARQALGLPANTDNGRDEAAS